MLHQTYFTDWHQILLVAAGFLTAILSVWFQSEQRFFYEKRKLDKEEQKLKDLIEQKNIESRISNRRISITLWSFWLYAGILFALLAFGLTGLDWLFTYQNGWIEYLAKGLLIGAFDITLIAVWKTVFIDYRTVSWAEEGKEQEPLNYGNNDEERTKNKRCLFGALCAALVVIVASSLVLAIKLPRYWCWLIFISFVVQISIVGGTCLKISCGTKR
jgi:hypothetical protein